MAARLGTWAAVAAMLGMAVCGGQVAMPAGDNPQAPAFEVKPGDLIHTTARLSEARLPGGRGGGRQGLHRGGHQPRRAGQRCYRHL